MQSACFNACGAIGKDIEQKRTGCLMKCPVSVFGGFEKVEAGQSARMREVRVSRVWRREGSLLVR